MEKKSLLAQMLETNLEERLAQIKALGIEDVLREAMVEIGLYVFCSDLDYVGPTGFCGTITVATDGMPERAKAAVEEVLRSQGIEDYDWCDYPVPGQVSVIWELVDGD